MVFAVQDAIEVLELKDIRREFNLALARSKLPNCSTGKVNVYNMSI